MVYYMKSFSLYSKKKYNAAIIIKKYIHNWLKHKKK